MSNRNAFLAVVLDADMLEALDGAARALQASPSVLLRMSSGVTFDPMRTDSLHMTFLFFGESLRGMPAVELRSLHAAVQAAVQARPAGAALATPLAFHGFELFPPEKMNLVIARFVATPPLLKLREEVLAACREYANSLPSSYFELIRFEGAWSPHVTLGKIRASRQELGRASCSGSGLRALSPARPAQPLGLTMLGERPPRAWCDWDEALAFEAPGAAPSSAAGEAAESDEHPGPPRGALPALERRGDAVRPARP